MVLWNLQPNFVIRSKFGSILFLVIFFLMRGHFFYLMLNKTFVFDIPVKH